MSAVPGVEDEFPAPREGGGYVNWAAVVEWCREHPGRARRVENVYAKAPYSVRQRYPDVTVTSKSNPHIEGKMRTCTVWVVYEK